MPNSVYTYLISVIKYGAKLYFEMDTPDSNYNPSRNSPFCSLGSIAFFAILPFASHFLLMQVSTITMFYWWLE